MRHRPIPLRAALAALSVTLWAPDPARAVQVASAALGIAPEPSLSIGSVDDDASAFQQIRALLPTRDGGMVVADGGSGSIRIFDRGGRLVRRFGSVGEGPGEFGQLAGLFRGRADSLVAFDFDGSGVSVFTGEGAFARSFRLAAPPAVPGRAELTGVLPDGRLLVQVYVERGDGRDDGNEVWIYTSAGVSSTRLATLPGRLVGGSGEGSVRIDIVVPWGAMPHAAVAGADAAIGHGSAYPVRLTTPGGEAREARPGTVDPRPVTDAVVEGFIEDLLLRVPEPVRPRIRPTLAALRDAPRPDHLPYFDRLLGSPDGGVWVGRFTAPGDPERRWDVFGPDGAFRSTVSVPGSVDVRYVEDDAVLAVFRDELDVEHARRYPLRRR